MNAKLEPVFRPLPARAAALCCPVPAPGVDSPPQLIVLLVELLEWTARLKFACPCAAFRGASYPRQ